MTKNQKQQIESLRKDGYTYKAIAGKGRIPSCRRLNAIGATTPSMRKVQLGIWHAEKYKTTEWFPRSIVDMLKNQYYVGDLVYGRIPKSLYEGVKMHRAPREEWRVISNHHEPIVDRELFERVQAIFAETSAIYKTKKDKTEEARASVINLFDKKIYCGDCEKRMRFIKRSMRSDKMYNDLTPELVAARKRAVELTDACFAKKVKIGNRVWVGGGVHLDYGITIGDNSVIGAGSVITRDIPANVVAAGAPCRVIRKITEEDRTDYFQVLEELY